MEKIARIILKYRILFFIIIGLLTGFFGYYAKQAATDNSIEVWLSKSDPGLDYYYSFIEKFGDEEFLIIAIKDNDIFNKDEFKLIDNITKRLETLEDVKSVVSLTSVFKDKLLSPYFKDIIKKNRGKKVINVFKDEILSDNMYVNNIISNDGNITAIIATVEKGSPESRMKLVNECRNIITTSVMDKENEIIPPGQPLSKGGIRKSDLSKRETMWTGLLKGTTRWLDILSGKTERSRALPDNYYFAGPSIVNAELDRMSQKDIRIFMPIMFAVAFIVLIILFRNFSGVLIPILTISINTVLAVGLFVIFDNKMNMVSGMLTPLIFIISLTTTIHILNRYYQETALSRDRKHNILETIKHIGIPCFLTCATTAIGFLSLVISDVPPVKSTGIFMAAGIMMSFFVCIILVPGILSLFPLPKSGTSTITSDKGKLNKAESLGISGHISNFIKNNNIWIFVFSIIFVGFAIYGITRVKVESNIFESFPKNSEITRSTSYIERNLMGLLPVEIVVDATNAGGIFQPEVLEKTENLQNFLNEIPEVTTSMSAADYVKRINSLLGKNDTISLQITREKSLDYVKLASLHGDSIVKNLYTKDNNEGRVSVRMENVGSSRYQEIIKNIKTYINSNFPQNIVCTITGIVPLLMDMQGYLIESQIKTFSLAFIFIFISITLLLKSLRIGMISIIPNIIPIAITLGIMGYLGIRLDVATIMIASIAIGISVDDTIHFLYRFKSEFQIDGNHNLAIHRTFSGVGRALVFTTVVGSCGFLMFSLSSFKPIQYFGLLTGITMAYALLADIFILPSCILLFKPNLDGPESIKSLSRQFPFNVPAKGGAEAKKLST